MFADIFKETLTMAKVYGLHEVELVPGADPEEFEKVASELAKGHGYEGWKLSLLKGERGERNGKYLIMVEIESLEARNRYAPSPDGPGSEEAQELDRRNATLWERLRNLTSATADIFTDYVAVA